MDAESHVALLVEGRSDKAALETVADRRGLRLADHAIDVISTEGITNFAAAMGDHQVVVGLYDIGEAHVVRAALERTGRSGAHATAHLEDHGFFACVEDLEDELLRALGTSVVSAILEAEGEAGSFRTMQRQPQWRDRSRHDQLRRFIGARSGRKHRMGALMAAALDITAVPTPLDAVLDAAVGATERRGR